MHGLIERLAILESWPGPSDSDLLATALALERNERLSWPRSVSRASSRIDEISLA
jgi:hypothetical protein